MNPQVSPPNNIPKNKFNILVKLIQEPLTPASTIAKMLGLSPTTTINAIEWLKQNQIFSSVHPDLNYDALDMELVDVIVRPLDYEAMRHLEMKKKDNSGTAVHSYFPHPYILYHVRIMGQKRGIFYQFQLPKGTLPLLSRFFDELKSMDLIEEYTYLPKDRSVKAYTIANLNTWDQERFSWKFDGENWIRQFYNQSYLYHASSPSSSLLSTLDLLDIYLLAELTLDARRKNKDLYEHAAREMKRKGLPFSEISSQALSRRITHLKTRFIERFRLFLNWRAFDIYNTSLFFVRASSPITREIAGYLQTRPELLPFDTRLNGLKTGFYWFARLPSSAVSYLSEFLWRLTTDVEYCFLDYRSSEIYAFWPEVYDPTTSYWRTDEEFMVHEPLRYLESYTPEPLPQKSFELAPLS